MLDRKGKRKKEENKTVKRERGRGDRNIFPTILMA